MSPTPQMIRPVERPVPAIRADALSHVAFKRRDIAKMVRFLEDFGFKALSQWPDGRRFMRSYGTAPYCVELIPADEDSFVGVGFQVNAASDLDLMAQRHGVPVETADVPGGGRRVTLTDPDGWRVELTHGAQALNPLPTPQTGAPTNTPFASVRVNRQVCKAEPPAPAAVVRMGHVVLQATDFARSSGWYMKELGLIPTDVQVVDDGTPALGFFRLDRGDKPADHHAVAFLTGPAPGVLHVSTETTDIDALGQGQQYLFGQGWTHHWGIGRHLLGSQIFDYWKDSAGDEWEHYADGDVMTADYPTGYHPLERGGLWAWGDDLPDSLRPPGVPAAPPQLKALAEALLVPPRPWLP